MTNYEAAREKYAALGVDTDKAIETLKKVPVSLHCWQLDDVIGFDNDGGLTGGIQTTGNYMGRARTPEQLMADMEEAMRLMPGTAKLNIHASYAIFAPGEFADRDALEPKHFAKWVEFAKKHHMGIDFNPTFFSHEKVKDGQTLSSPDEETRRFWINHGKASAYYQIGGSDRMAEISLVRRDLELALSTGAAFDVQHISAKESVALVREVKKRAKEMGMDNIHAEATPHHFSLTEEAAIQYGTLAKMNPPLREEADRMAVIEGLADGTIDLIATDHAPHSAEEKAKPLTEAPSGIIGLETAFSLAVTNLIRPGYLDLPTLFERMSLAPAKLYHLPAGQIKEDMPADLIVFDDAAEVVYEKFASKSSNSPFTGQKLYGRIEMTICEGKEIQK